MDINKGKDNGDKRVRINIINGVQYDDIDEFYRVLKEKNENIITLVDTLNIIQ